MERWPGWWLRVPACRRRLVELPPGELWSGTRRDSKPGRSPVPGLAAESRPILGLVTRTTRDYVMKRLIFSSLSSSYGSCVVTGLGDGISADAEEERWNLLEHLCRLDAVGLHRRVRHHETSTPRNTASTSRSCRSTTMSSPINQYTAGEFDGVDADQHGRAVDPGRRRRRYHRASSSATSPTAMTASSSRRRRTRSPISRGPSVNLVELSVSHYLLARGLDTVGLHGGRHQSASTPPMPTWSRPSPRRPSPRS